MLNWHAWLVDLLHLDLLSMIGRISLPCDNHTTNLISRKLTGLHGHC
jgi:hypothetical protein